MTTTTDTPRIYVASLHDYNAGRLHGEWIDVEPGMDADDIYERVQAMLKRSPEPWYAEEWAIHDYEGFGARLNEYTSFETVAQLAELIHEHGEAFTAYAKIAHDEGWNLDDFEDHYRGEWESARQYAEEFAYDIYGDWLDNLLSYKQSGGLSDAISIDWDRYADILELVEVRLDYDKVFIFD